MALASNITMLPDLRYAVRVLFKTPTFTVVTVLTIALAIGANTAVFTLLNAMFIRPLPFPEPQRLVMVWEATSMFGLRHSPPAMGNYVEWRRENSVFERMGSLENGSVPLLTDSGPEQADGSIVGASLFRTLGVAPIIGRDFTDEEDRPGTAKVVILSYGLWQRLLGGRTDLKGASVRIMGEPFTVVGVMPRDFRFPNADTALWVPGGAVYKASEYENRGRHDLMVVARLKPGATIERANEDIQALANRAEREYPKTNRGVGAFVAPMREHMTGDTKRLLQVLGGASGLILLIACANLANLFLARAVARRREFAVRISLGAGAREVARQVLAEAMLIAAAGGAAGLLLATYCFEYLRRLIPPALVGLTELSPDWRVLLFTAAVSVGAALLFSLAPLFYSARTDVQSAIKASGERGSSASHGRRLREALVAGQIALALVLLIGAGLLVRTLHSLRYVDPTLRQESVLTLKVPFRMRDAEARDRFFGDAVERVSGLPGVIAAGFSTGVPLAFKGFQVGIEPEGHAPGTRVSVRYRVVTPDYFRAMGIPLRAGRNVSEADGKDGPRVALVNETLARKLWPDRDPLGRHFRQGPSEAPAVEVVGVVADVRQVGADMPPQPEIYMPYRQESSFPQWLAVRTAGDPKALVSAIRKTIASIDPDQPVVNARTMVEVLDAELLGRETQTVLLGLLSALALAVAGIGVYGVMAYSVTQRTPEIGIRIALGAQPGDVRRTVLGRSLLVIGWGVAAGVVGALFLTRAMSHMLFGVEARDPVTFAVMGVLMCAAGVVAAYVPVRRAMRVDPVEAMRES
jgi:putative ABC transport system permease protein